MNAMPHMEEIQITLARRSEHSNTATNYLEGGNVCEDKSGSELPADDDRK